MKQLLILITLMSSLIMSSVAYADWTKVLTENGNNIYADYDKVRERNGNYLVWMLGNYAGSSSSLHLAEVDCALFRVKVLQLTFYEKHWASGSSKRVQGTADPWNFMEPNSYEERLYKKICKKLD